MEENVAMHMWRIAGGMGDGDASVAGSTVAGRLKRCLPVADQPFNFR